MHEIGQRSVPTSETDTEVFSSLRLAESSERVNIHLDERMLSIQGRRTTAINVRMGAIDTVQHHSTHLVPAWLVVLGAAFMWIGYRLLVPPLYRLAFIGLGALLILARVFTKQPTFTVHASSGDSHVLFGNEATLHRLGFMVNKVLKGKSIEEARTNYEAILAVSFRDWNDSEILPAPDLPVIIHQPVSIDRLLHPTENEPVMAAQTDDQMDWLPTDDATPPAPSLLPSFLNTYYGQQSQAESSSYGPGHRPGPLAHPILVPVPVAPPMHQEVGRATGEALQPLPSFWGRSEVHIPSQHQSIESELDDDEELLDAELVDDIAEPEVESDPQASQPETHQVLKNREPRRIEDTPFRPRRVSGFSSRQPQSRGFFTRLRDVSVSLMRNSIAPASPSPYATTETSGALRESTENNTPPNEEILDRLSIEKGGLLEQAEADRIAARARAILATAEDLTSETQENFDDLSFGDLTPTISEDEKVNVRRLDDD